MRNGSEQQSPVLCMKFPVVSIQQILFLSFLLLVPIRKSLLVLSPTQTTPGDVQGVPRHRVGALYRPCISTVIWGVILETKRRWRNPEWPARVYKAVYGRADGRSLGRGLRHRTGVEGGRFPFANGSCLPKNRIRNGVYRSPERAKIMHTRVSKTIEQRYEAKRIREQ